MLARQRFRHPTVTTWSSVDGQLGCPSRWAPLRTPRAYQEGMATKTIITTFEDVRSAEAVVHRLHDAGFARDDLGWVAKAANGEEVAHGSASTVGSSALEGAEVGGALGSLAGLLLGFAALAVPGIGPVVVAGPILSALAGLGVGAAAGGIIDALVHVGVPRDEAKRYAEQLRAGAALVTVTVDDDEEETRAIAILRGESVAPRKSVRMRAASYTDEGRPSVQSLV